MANEDLNQEEIVEVEALARKLEFELSKIDIEEVQTALEKAKEKGIVLWVGTLISFLVMGAIPIFDGELRMNGIEIYRNVVKSVLGISCLASVILTIKAGVAHWRFEQWHRFRELVQRMT